MEKKTTYLEAANLLMFCEMGSVWWDGSGLCIPVGLDLFSPAPSSTSLLWLGEYPLQILYLHYLVLFLTAEKNLKGARQHGMPLLKIPLLRH